MDEGSAALVEYVLVTDKGETKNTSVEFTGKGKATYPNGDVYEGEFVDGVSAPPPRAKCSCGRLARLRTARDSFFITSQFDDATLFVNHNESQGEKIIQSFDY